MHGEEKSRRLQHERAVDAERDADGRTADASGIPEHLSGCLHADAAGHRISAPVPQAIPHENREYALEATGDCTAHDTHLGPGTSTSDAYPSIHGAASGECRGLPDRTAIHICHAECCAISTTKLCASLGPWTARLFFGWLSFRFNIRTKRFLNLVRSFKSDIDS